MTALTERVPGEVEGAGRGAVSITYEPGWCKTRIRQPAAGAEAAPTPKLSRPTLEIVAEPTEVACRLLQAADPGDVAAVFHVTC